MTAKLILVLALVAALAPAGGALAARTSSPAKSQGPASDAPAADGAAAGPVFSYGGLLALSEDQTRARLGVPDLARSEGAGAMWTYRLNDCALFVFFRAAGGQPLKVSGAAAGQRRRGQPIITLEACIAEALNAHGASGGRSRPQ